MFANKTVFIFGAGASCHYGFPTGEELVEEVINKSKSAADFFRSKEVVPVFMPRFFKEKMAVKNALTTNEWKNAWENAANECDDLAQRLEQVNPLVIDYFLGQNPTLQEIGKLMIAWVILEREARFIEIRKKKNTNIYDQGKCDWLRFILHKLMNDSHSINDLCNSNKIHFITFNYDTSLERHLYTRLCLIDKFKEHEDEIKQFINDRTFHVYGKIRKNPCNDFEPTFIGNVCANDRPQRYMNVIDTAYDASKELRTIYPDDKDQNKENLKYAKNAIKNAEQIYILGYGFDENNNKRLDLYNLLHVKPSKEKRIFFTNYEDRNSVNKEVGKIVAHDKKTFLPPEYMYETRNNNEPHNDFYCEKSIRNVYEALERDFDF